MTHLSMGTLVSDQWITINYYLNAHIHFLTYFTLYDRLYTYITYHASMWDLGKWYR